MMIQKFFFVRWNMKWFVTTTTTKTGNSHSKFSKHTHTHTNNYWYYALLTHRQILNNSKFGISHSQNKTEKKFIHSMHKIIIFFFLSCQIDWLIFCFFSFFLLFVFHFFLNQWWFFFFGFYWLLIYQKKQNTHNT